MEITGLNLNLSGGMTSREGLSPRQQAPAHSVNNVGGLLQHYGKLSDYACITPQPTVYSIMRVIWTSAVGPSYLECQHIPVLNRQY